MKKQCEYDNVYPVLSALNIIDRKWRMPILWKLVNSPLRYNELKRQLLFQIQYFLERRIK